MAKPDALPEAAAMAPLRMGLVSDVWPMAHAFPGCSDGADAAASTRSGFMVERAAAMRIVPRLTLVGFSRTGCAMDAAVGGGLVYARPLTKTTWLVASGGGVLLPHGSPTTQALPRVDLRADVVIKGEADRTWSVGVGLRGVRFGGFF
jgi:hypothetical protein